MSYRWLLLILGEERSTQLSSLIALVERLPIRCGRNCGTAEDAVSVPFTNRVV